VGKSRDDFGYCQDTEGLPCLTMRERGVLACATAIGISQRKYGIAFSKTMIFQDLALASFYFVNLGSLMN
jgi:hypothetical protein